MSRFLFGFILLVQILSLSMVFAQQHSSSSSQTLSTPNVPRQIVIPNQPLPPGLTSSPYGAPLQRQLETLRYLTPEQQSVLQNFYMQRGFSTDLTGTCNPAIQDCSSLLPFDEKSKDAQSLLFDTRFKEKLEPTSIFTRFLKSYSYQNIDINLKPFGFNFFKEAANKRTKERKDLPVPPDYVIGHGDEIKIMLWGRVNAQHNLIVDRDGKINIPTIGPIHVAGYTFEQMASNLIKQAEQIVGANISVTMGALKSLPIFILGDVKNPGAYMIGSFSTITDAILLAGGPSDIGSLREIQLRRKDKIIATFDFYDLLLKGDKSKDIMLQAGDVVFVPVTGALVGIAGNVKRPAIYEIKPGTTLAELFEIAGGLLPTGQTQQIQVERVIKNDKKVVLDINDKSLTTSKTFILQDADLIKVFNIVEKDKNALFLYGNVKKPGKYEYKNGMKLLDIIKSPDDLLPETYMQYARIIRTTPPDDRPVNVTVNLYKLFVQKDQTANIPLQALDKIYIYSKWDFKDRPSVYVEGEVRRLVAKDTEAFEDIKELAESKDFKDALSADRFDKFEPSTSYPFKDTKTPPEFYDTQSRYDYKVRQPISRVDKSDFIDTDLINKQAPLYKRERSEIRDFSYQDKTDTTEKTTSKDDIDTKLRIEALKAQISELKLQAQRIKDIDPITYKRQELEIKKLETELTELQKLAGKKAPFVKVEILENYRIKDAILQAGGLTNDAYLQRGILIRLGEDKKPKTLYFNVAKAMQGDEAENLLLQDEDRIIIRSVYEHQYKQTVDVQGEVLNPGKYPYSQNMRVSDLIFAAGNVLESAFMQEAELSTQKIVDGRFVSVNHRQINLAKALAGDPEHDVLLSPYDTLTVKKMSDWGADRYVEIKGEVAFPGRYKIKKGERLSDLIQRAGGFTANAYPKAAVFTRERVREMQQKSIDEMVMRLEREFFAESAKAISTSLSAEEVQSKMAETEYKKRFLESLRNLKPTGRMTIMLTSHMRLLKGSEYDIELENGDTLLIPEKNSVVNVMGSVMSQSSLIYSPRLDYRDYIDMAGGVSTNADTANIYVLKADGSARRLSSSWISWGAKKSRWELTAFDDTERDIEPGDTIVVPEKVEKIAWLREIKDITQILMQIAVTAGVVIKLF